MDIGVYFGHFTKVTRVYSLLYSSTIASHDTSTQGWQDFIPLMAHSHDRHVTFLPALQPLHCIQPFGFVLFSTPLPRKKSQWLSLSSNILCLRIKVERRRKFCFLS